MTAIGMETFLSRPPNHSPTDAERAATANAVGADLMISLRCASLASPSANGVASFHFGNSHGSVSTIGRMLADFIQREVVARTGLRDCRIHGRTWDLLRLTRMPTVQVDIGYITNPHDRAKLVTPHARDAIAEGILAAVKRLYLLGKTTGRPEPSPLPSYWPTSLRWSRRAASPARSRRPRPHRLLQLCILKQPLQRRFHLGLPPQAFVEL